jgi:C1A family cysteine protease
MSKLTCVLAVVLGLVVATTAIAPLSDAQYEMIFTKFVAAYQKQYHHDAFFTKYRTFRQNFDMIRAHNEDTTQTFTMGINQFADLTAEEFDATSKGYKPRAANYARSLNAPHETVNAPTSWDWTTQPNVVTPVKDQGQCGSCWAFSSTGSIEGAHGIATGSLVSLSEQQLVDCSGSYGNQGCNGGLMDDAFEYVIGTGGLCTEASYPYTAADGTCQTTCTRVVQISSYADVTANNETALLNAVALRPVSVAIQANQLAFQFYTSGVITGRCGTQLDHGVLTVGYGVWTDNTPYWKVKNSWGASWGMSGYVLIQRATSGTGPGKCGIAMQPSYPIV